MNNLGLAVDSVFWTLLIVSKVIWRRFGECHYYENPQTFIGIHTNDVFVSHFDRRIKRIENCCPKLFFPNRHITDRSCSNERFVRTI